MGRDALHLEFTVRGELEGELTEPKGSDEHISTVSEIDGKRCEGIAEAQAVVPAGFALQSVR
jgi:hypothetical protein